MKHILNSIKKYNETFIGIILFIIGFILFSSQRSATPLAGDEPFTVYFAQWPVASILEYLMADSNIPLTYEILLHYWIKLFSTRAADVRLFPVIFSALTIPALYIIGIILKDKTTGVIACILFMLAPIQYEWAHLVRSYSLMIACIAWSVAAVLLYLRNPKNAYIILWVVLSAMAIAVHYLSALIILTGWCFLVGHSLKHKEYFRKICIATIAILFISSPFIYILIKRYFAVLEEGTYIQPPASSLPFFQEVIKMLGTSKVYLLAVAIISALSLIIAILTKQTKDFFFQKISLFLLTSALIVFSTISYLSLTDPSYAPSWFSQQIVITLIVLSVLVALIRYRFHPIQMVLLWFLFPYIIMFLLSFKTPMFIDRYLSFTSPALYLMIAYALGQLHQQVRIVVSIVIFSLALLQVSLTPERFVRPDIIVNRYREVRIASDITILSPGYTDLPLTYYYSRGIYNDALAQLTDTVGKKIVVEEGYTRHKEGLRRALAREKIFIANSFQDLQLSLDTIKSVIFLDVYSQYIYPQNAIKYNCEQVYGAPKTVVDLGNGIMIYRYEKEELYLNLK
jgi:uncharacterized membrane protein